MELGNRSNAVRVRLKGISFLPFFTGDRVKLRKTKDEHKTPYLTSDEKIWIGGLHSAPTFWVFLLKFFTRIDCISTALYRLHIFDASVVVPNLVLS